MFALFFIKVVQMLPDASKVTDRSSHKHYHLCVSAHFMHKLAPAALHKGDKCMQIRSDKCALYINNAIQRYLTW